MPNYGMIAKIAVSAFEKAGKAVGKSIREMPKPRAAVKIKPGIVGPAVTSVSKESQTIGANAINHYNDILKQIPDGPNKIDLLADLDTKVWGRTNLIQRVKLDEAIQTLSGKGINLKRGINSRGITEIPQIKPYGYWTVRLPHGEIKFGFSYPALLHISEKLTPIQKSRFLSSLEEALRLPLKPGSSSKITDSIKLIFDEAKNKKEITVLIGDLKLEGFQWKDGVYTIDTIY